MIADVPKQAYGCAYGTGLQLVGGKAPKPLVGVLTNNVNDDQFFTICGTFRLIKEKMEFEFEISLILPS